MSRFYLRLALAALATVTSFTSWAHAQIIATGLTSTGSLVTFDVNAPGTILTTSSVTGLTAGDVLTSIDFRPIDQQLIGYGYNATTGTARVYSLTPAGAATSINANSLNPGAGLARIIADFNPTANALRLTSSAATGNNLRMPAGGTGVQTTDTDLNPANTGIRASAYSRNRAGGGTSGATTLYLIDGTNNSLVNQGSINFFTGSGTSPNTGTLTNVAGLTGVTGSTVVGFDIVNGPGTAASFQGDAFLATSNTLFSLNLQTGAATSLGGIGSGLTISDIALVAVPEPSTIILCTVGAMGLGYAGVRRWKTRRRNTTFGKLA